MLSLFTKSFKLLPNLSSFHITRVLPGWRALRQLINPGLLSCLDPDWLSE